MIFSFLLYFNLKKEIYCPMCAEKLDIFENYNIAKIVLYKIGKVSYNILGQVVMLR